MSSRRRSGVIGTHDGADAVGDALLQVAQSLAYLQEALRQQKQKAKRKLQEAERRMQETLHLQKQEAERRVQEALHLHKKQAERRMQMALRLQEETLREMNRKLQEKDDAIHTLQERLQETHVKMTALQERSTAPEGSAGEGLQRLEGRVNEGEASLRSAFMPQVETFLRQLQEPQSTRATDGTAAAASARREPAFVRARGGGEETPFFSSTLTPSGAGLLGAPTDEERRWVELRVRQARLKWERAQTTPSPLEEELCKAAEEGRLSDVRRLTDSGADVNYTDRYGSTPLVNAVFNAHADVVSLLLQRGADVNAVNRNGASALHLAAWNDSSGQRVELLVRAGADVNARDIDGATPLHRAALYYNEEVVRALLAAGARRDLKGWGGYYKGRTPFETTMSLLFRISYDCNVKNVQGDIPLH